jgi:hypothetical protein
MRHDPGACRKPLGALYIESGKEWDSLFPASSLWTVDAGVLIVSGREPAPVFEAVERSLDDVAAAIGVSRNG